MTDSPLNVVLNIMLIMQQITAPDSQRKTRLHGYANFNKPAYTVIQILFVCAYFC